LADGDDGLGGNSFEVNVRVCHSCCFRYAIFKFPGG
jgi:hypothetical protein